MTTMSDRASLTYTGDDTIELVGWAHASPSILEPGDTVELDAEAATLLLNADGDSWQPAGPVPEGVLRGADLDAALEAAGLPRTGTVAEKRARLTEHEAAESSPATTDPEGTSTDE